MKTSFCLSIAAAVLLVGCGENTAKSPAPAPTSTNSSGSSVLTAPVDYLGALGKGKQVAEKTIDVSSLNNAIQLFNATEGRNPKDLNEMVENGLIREIPKPPYGMKLVYDAQAGRVSAVKE
jgi:hypothetical protein